MTRSPLSELLMGLAVASLLAAPACAEGAAPSPAPQSMAASPAARATAPPGPQRWAAMPHGEIVALDPLGTAALAPDLTPGLPEPQVRPRKRLDVPQLRAALTQAMGGLVWEDASGHDRFEALAATLGEPDYIDRTQEDRAPSLLFHKFLDDAARDLCTRRVQLDWTAPTAERVLLTGVDPNVAPAEQPEATTALLQAALLRFHGRAVAAGSPELDRWRWLLDAVSHVAEAPGQPTEFEGAGGLTARQLPWRSLCVALTTHPDFVTY